jgi:chromosome segregation ATPase
MDGLQLLFAIFLELLKICTGNNLAENKALPLAPLLRAEVRKLDQYIEDHQFLCDCHIDTAEELSAFRASTSAKIAELEKQREQIRNRIRRAPETEQNHLKEQAKAITSQITPLRKQIKIADRIMERSTRMRQLLDQERQLETNEITKERKFER